MSFGFLFGMFFVLTIAAGTALYFGVLGLLNFLTKPIEDDERNYGRNWFFTQVQEGQVKVVLKWRKFHRAIMVYKDHQFDESWTVRNVSEFKDSRTILVWDEEKNEYAKKPVKPNQYQPKGWGGIFWIGIWPIYTVHRYKFRFSSFRQTKDEKTGRLKEETVFREPIIDYILVQDDTYFTEVKAAETKGMVPLDVDLLITARVTNPYKALFRAQEWLEQTINVLKPNVRKWVSNKEYEDVINKEEGLERTMDELLARPEPKSGGPKEKEPGKPEKEGLAEYVNRNYGVRIKKLGIASFHPTQEKHVEIASRPWEALRDAESIRTRAQAEVDRVKAVYETIHNQGEDGLAIRTLESLDRAGDKGSNLIIPFGGPIREMLTGLLGKKEGK